MKVFPLFEKTKCFDSDILSDIKMSKLGFKFVIIKQNV